VHPSSACAPASWPPQVSGKVTNVAAWTTHQGGRDAVFYTTAKTALAGFRRALAIEWAGHGGGSTVWRRACFPTSSR
jgi:NAD(P)-dependent dehydrogenase (short-subunit alcohol dehydrogenase family)